MATKKFVDQNGLKHFWDTIKEMFYKKTDADAKFVTIEQANASYFPQDPVRFRSTVEDIAADTFQTKTLAQQHETQSTTRMDGIDARIDSLDTLYVKNDTAYTTLMSNWDTQITDNTNDLTDVKNRLRTAENRVEAVDEVALAAIRKPASGVVGQVLTCVNTDGTVALRDLPGEQEPIDVHELTAAEVLNIMNQ